MINSKLLEAYVAADKRLSNLSIFFMKQDSIVSKEASSVIAAYRRCVYDMFFQEFLTLSDLWEVNQKLNPGSNSPYPVDRSSGAALSPFIPVLKAPWNLVLQKQNYLSNLKKV